MNGINDLKNYWNKIIDKIQNDEIEFKKYLDFTAKFYKYSFADSLLIYAQRPDATMVADMNLWNEKVGRWIKRGSTSIAVFGETENSIRRLFDVADTYGENKPQQWKLSVDSAFLLKDKWIAESVAAKKKDKYQFFECLKEKTIDALENNIAQYYNEFKKKLATQLIPQSDLLLKEYVNVLVNSSAYIVAERLQYNSKVRIGGATPFSFDNYNISNINKEAFIILGSQICETAHLVINNTITEINEINKQRRMENEKSTENNREDDSSTLYSTEKNRTY